ncbi:hypothetical protein [Cellulomonas sp. PhB143]|uniref:hypothetical protein n=1 Tax=Cellulomonas sp. PhB143 TaxID=2485186 RepID=UPI0011CDB993|nr:hypothetical protein [Cellulomonas sp. PhB143]
MPGRHSGYELDPDAQSTVREAQDAARMVLSRPPYRRPSYRALTARDPLPPEGFVVTQAVPTTSDVRVVAGQRGVRYVVAFMNQTARDVSAISPDPTSTEVAVLPGAVFGAAGSFRPYGATYDVLIAVELLREPGPEPGWPAENAAIEAMISEALLRPGLPSPIGRERYLGPLPVGPFQG